MKKVTLFILVLFCISSIHAQNLRKGGWLADGSTSLKFGSQNQGDGDKYHETNFRFRPDFGYFICTAFALGLALEMQSSSYHINSNDPTKSNSFSAGLFARYYFCKPAMKHNLFAEAGFDVGGTKFQNSDRQNFNTFILGLSYVCFLNSHVGFEMGLDWRSTHDQGDPDTYKRFSSFGLCGGFQIYLDPCRPHHVIAQ